MPSHSKAIREYAQQHAVAEALGVVAVALYVAVLGGVIYQVALFSGILH